jgi:PAS domain S-box-containing protein
MTVRTPGERSLVDAGQRHRIGALAEPSQEHESRSVAQLKMLHNLAPRLNRLNDVQQIGDAITAELKTLIDYHSCRVYLLAEDGVALIPIVFRGDLTEYQSDTYEDLVTQVGEGFTGHAAATGETYYAADALRDDIGVQIEGTDEVEESILCVPLKYGDSVTGVIVLSNLGLDQCDAEDQRLVEVLASHAAVAFENARLFQKEREAAETASALLGLSQSLTGAHDVGTVLERVVAAVPFILPCSVVATYLHDRATGSFRLMHERGGDADRVRSARETDVTAEVAARFLLSVNEPFILSKEILKDVPSQYVLLADVRETLIAPLRWDPDGFGAVAIVAADDDASFSDHDVVLARGIADMASLAIGSARRVHELERFHELVESLEAIFWEADPHSLAFTFLSRRAALVFGRPDGDGSPDPGSWGEHIHPEDRVAAIAALRAAIEDGGDSSTEYRALGREGETIWLRDLIHVVQDARGTRTLRGLIVDVTERKRAEQALRRSEQQYSEAFRREREATDRLRALDDMKNTFLEAVSHDLRTPLTSILGSALTLEQSGLDIPKDDAQDLLRRIAANARKLERLLSDLLDLDRLQRGIVSPQRRPTDIGELIQQTVDEPDLLAGRPVEVEVDSLIASVDAAKVERILENLLSNAVRHTPAGSRIWIRASREDGGILIVVEDEGPGVPEEMREAVFEPFRQIQDLATRNPSPGVGVGLSLVSRFAELHGGSAWVQDRQGGGASFRVLLPES